MPNDTFYRRLSSFGARAGVRRFVAVAVLVEAGLVLGWLSIDHREHIVEFVGRTVAELRGEPTNRVTICTAKRGAPTRVALVRIGE